MSAASPISAYFLDSTLGNELFGFNGLERRASSVFETLNSRGSGSLFPIFESAMPLTGVNDASTNWTFQNNSIDFSYLYPSVSVDSSSQANELTTKSNMLAYSLPPSQTISPSDLIMPPPSIAISLPYNAPFSYLPNDFHPSMESYEEQAGQGVASTSKASQPSSPSPALNSPVSGDDSPSSTPTMPSRRWRRKNDDDDDEYIPSNPSPNRASYRRTGRTRPSFRAAPYPSPRQSPDPLPRPYYRRTSTSSSKPTSTSSIRASSSRRMLEKVHHCDQCSRSFARPHDLTRHKRGHSGDAPYTCYGCLTSFKRSDARKRHLDASGATHCRAKHAECMDREEQEKMALRREQYERNLASGAMAKGGNEPVIVHLAAKSSSREYQAARRGAVPVLH